MTRLQAVWGGYEIDGRRGEGSDGVSKAWIMMLSKSLKPVPTKEEQIYP